MSPQNSVHVHIGPSKCKEKLNCSQSESGWHWLWGLRGRGGHTGGFRSAHGFSLPTWALVTAYLFYNYSFSLTYTFYRLFHITLTISVFKNTNRTPETFHIREESPERREFPHLPEAQAEAWRVGLECPQRRRVLSRPRRELSQCRKHGLSGWRIRLLKPITEQRPASLRPRTSV